MRLAKRVRLAVLAAFVVAAFAAVRYTETGRYWTNADNLQAALKSISPWDRVAYVALYVVGAVLLVPGTAISFVGAILYGVWQGTLMTWIGANAGACAAFWFARVFRPPVADEAATTDASRSLVARVDDWISRRGVAGVLVARVLPFPYNVVNYICGLSRMPFLPYAAATALGILPGTFVYQYLFASVGPEVLANGVRLEYLGSKELWLPVAAFAAFVIVGGLLSRRLLASGNDANDNTAEPESPR